MAEPSEVQGHDAYASRREFHGLRVEHPKAVRPAMDKDQRPALPPVLNVELHARFHLYVTGNVRHSYRLLVPTGGLKALSVP